ncbi:MAG: SLBB domain-containing protein [Alphaproteobacteria bacterium]
MPKRISFLLYICTALAWTNASFAQSPIPVAPAFMVKYERLAQVRDPHDLYEKDIPREEHQQRQSNPTNETSPAEIAPQNPIIPIETPTETFSALETIYSARTESTLTQFGYDLFGVPAKETQDHLDALARNTPRSPMGAAQDDFILHAGDELSVIFTGQRTDQGSYKINSEGLLVIPDLPPIPADGRAIGQVRLSIEMAAHNLHNTKAFVSLSSVRQIDVIVVGHVKRPGRLTLTVFHTVVDALMEAGGIDKTGSLRQIKLVRGANKSINIDLYTLLMRGGTNMDLQLRDGDRIVIPPIGPTVAVAGEVKRPGIFELLPHDENLTLAEMLELSGGVLAPGRNRFMNLEITRSGHEKLSELHDTKQPVFGEGAILMVAKGTEKRAGTIELLGDTRRPGLYALGETPTLSSLLSSSDVLGADAYPLIGLIERRNPDTLARNLIAFPLRPVLKGEHDMKLEDGDKIRIFSAKEIRTLDLEDDTLISFLKERTSFIRGAVRSPGAYPVADGVTLDSLIAVAGGSTIEADTDKIEVTTETQKRRTVTLPETQSIIIHPGDAARINQKFQRVEEKSALILGEVKNPGRYDLAPGDKISDLLTRAGGLTDQAYPAGAIFSRETERRAEESRFKAQARDMQRAIAATLEQDKDKISADQIAQARALAIELEQAEGVGRITIEADPSILERDPDLDMLLEPGDRLFIPKRSLTVRVSGEVFSPASLQFRKGKEAETYIREAGGTTYNADKGRIFVIHPDGSASPLDGGAWNHDDDNFIPPGSTLVVPRDPKPFNFIESAKDISQILSNLAITSLFIDDVRDGD